MPDRRERPEALRGRKMMQNMRKWVNTWLGASVGVAVGAAFPGYGDRGPRRRAPGQRQSGRETDSGTAIVPGDPGHRSMPGQDRMPPHQSPGADRVQGDGGLSRTPKAGQTQEETQVTVGRVQNQIGPESSLKGRNLRVSALGFSTPPQASYQIMPRHHCKITVGGRLPPLPAGT